MDYLEILDYDRMAPEAREVVDKIKARLGRIPNAYGIMANSPAALKAFMEFYTLLKKGTLRSREIEAVALVIFQSIGCLYCIAAHTEIARRHKMTEQEVNDLRLGKSADPKLNALVQLAKDIYLSKGQPRQEYIEAFFAAGYNQAALVEVIAQVALNVFSGYLNKIAQTPIDAPKDKEEG